MQVTYLYRTIVLAIPSQPYHLLHSIEKVLDVSLFVLVIVITLYKKINLKKIHGTLSRLKK